MYGVRPNLVVGEATTDGAHSVDTVTDYGLQDVAKVDITMSNKFEDQFLSKYLPRIFPWALNYDCGGADYPDLFADWEAFTKSPEHDGILDSLKERWRREKREAPLLPGPYAQMLAVRPEMQVAGDWMLVPATRNLHWRYAVLRSAFIVCKHRLPPGETLHENVERMVQATEKIWRKISGNLAIVNGRKRPINGNLSMLFADDDMGAAEKTVLRAYLDTTRNVAGCQAIRQRIGHILFGFRCVQGEVVFVTVSPNRRNSSMILTLSRVRPGDSSLRREDETTKARRTHASSTSPKVFTQWDLIGDPDGQKVYKEIQLPELLIRQKWNSQDPLSSVHHYLIIMYVALPAAFGVRMCMSCPHCNKDVLPHERPERMRTPCVACASAWEDSLESQPV